MEEQKNFFTSKEASIYLGVSPHTLQKWRKDKRGPKYRRMSHKLVLYSRDDLDDWVQECEYGTNWVQVADALPKVTTKKD